MLVLPAIDILGGKCVRLSQGEYGQSKIYSEDPVQVALRFQSEGAKMIHVVDLDGAKLGRPVNLSVIGAIARSLQVPIQVGGGVRDLSAANTFLNAGAERVVAGSVLAKNRRTSAELIASLGERLVAGVDARDGLVATEGWTETSQTKATDLCRMLEEEGARRFIVTDISRDGMLAGPNLGFLSEILSCIDSPVIASGGVTVPSDLGDLQILNPRPPEAVIVGKAIYEGKINLSEAMGAQGPANLKPQL